MHLGSLLSGPQTRCVKERVDLKDDTAAARLRLLRLNLTTVSTWLSPCIMYLTTVALQ